MMQGRAELGRLVGRASRRRAATMAVLLLLAGACATPDNAEDHVSTGPVRSTDAGSDSVTEPSEEPTRRSGSGSSASDADDSGPESVGVADAVTIEVRDP